MTSSTAPVADAAGGATVNDRSAAGGRLQFDRNTTFWGLLVPPSAWLFCFFLVPLVLIAVISLRPDLRGGLTSPFTPSLAQYQLLTEKANYFRLLGTSIGVASLRARFPALAALC